MSTGKFIADLPPEILLSIFEYVRETTSLNDFLPTVMVCHHWNELCSPLIWTNIVLSTTTLNRFATSTGGTSINDRRAPSRLAARENTLKLVQNISIKIASVLRRRQWNGGMAMFPGKLPFPEQLPEWLASELAEQTSTTRSFSIGLWKLSSYVLPRCSNLKTFSFRVDPLPDEGLPSPDGRSFKVSGRLLRELLEALPDSCTSLEFDIFRETEPLCRTIRHLLPCLHHLRLRLGHICPAIVIPKYQCSPDQGPLPFEEPLKAPHLKTFTVNLRPRPLIGAFFDGSRVFDLYDGLKSYPSVRQMSIKDASQYHHNLIRHTLQVAFRQKAFPNINHLAVLNVVQEARKSTSLMIPPYSVSRIEYSCANVTSGTKETIPAVNGEDDFYQYFGGREFILKSPDRNDP